MIVNVQLNLIILAVRDLERAWAFYRQVFEWEILVNAPTYKEFRMKSRQRLGLYHHEGFGRNTGQTAALPPEGQTSATELYFYAEDPPVLMARLKEAGARLLSPMSRRAWNDEAAYFVDPDGNVLVIATEPAG